MFTTFAERYASRPGGYTRILRSGYRVGDNAPLAILELVDNKNDLRFESSAKTAGRELAILSHSSGDKNSFKSFRSRIEADGEGSIVDNLQLAKELGSVTRKNIAKALQFRTSPLLSLPVDSSSTTKPISSISSTPTLESDSSSSSSSSSDQLEPVKSLHPSTLFLDRVYHHYLSTLASFSLSQTSYSPDPSRQISQLTQRLHPTELKSAPKPVLTVPMTGKKFLAGEDRRGYEGQVDGERMVGPIGRAKGDWGRMGLDRKRRFGGEKRHASIEMEQLEKELEERL